MNPGTLLPCYPYRRENHFLIAQAALAAFVCILGLSRLAAYHLQGARFLGILLICGLYVAVPFRLFSARRLLLLIGLCFFPVLVSVAGRDAFSTATFLILLTALFYLWRMVLCFREEPWPPLLGWALPLLAIALGGTLAAPRSHWGLEMRHLLNLAAGLALLLMLVQAPKFTEIPAAKLARAVLIWVLILTVFQVLLGLAAFYLPHTADWFRLFLNRTQEELSISANQYNDIVRLQTLVLSAEALGELLAMLMPLALYFALTGRSRWWLAVGALWIGLFYANTRSGLLLAGFATAIIVPIWLPRMRLRDGFMFCVLAPLAAGLFLAWKPEVGRAVLIHLDQAWQIAQEGGHWIEVVNREDVWPDSWHTVLHFMNLFGNGPAPAIGLGRAEFQMHSLYMTLLYQYGWVGALWYLCLFPALFFRLMRPGRDRAFRLICALSLSLFLINEIKYEFNRHDSYQQIIWALLAAFWLAGQPEKENKDHELIRP